MTSTRAPQERQMSAQGFYLWPLRGEGDALTEVRPFAIQLEQSWRQFGQV
jgi:hypothetical protein